MGAPLQITPTLWAGQDALQLQWARGDRACVLLQGAHCVSWCSPDGRERLYTSPRAVYAPGVAVRGGVPVIFPQFERRGPLTRHGLARTARWTPVFEAEDLAAGRVRLRWQDSPDTRAQWPAAFEVDWTLAPSEHGVGMTAALTVRHRDPQGAPWSFSAALHSYFRLDPHAPSRLLGLPAQPSFQNMRPHDPVRPLQAPWSAVDRIDAAPATPLQLRTGDQRLDLHQSGFEQVVVWNPGPEGAAALNDLPPADYAALLCVEAAQIDPPLTLHAGQSWRGSQTWIVAGA